ncbi:MAG: regulatory iron-sulfur-containing complex subunit RicT [Nitrospirota bacterium]
MNENNAVEIDKEPKSPESSTVVGIRFRSCGKIYTFDANNIDTVPGSRVVVDSELGLSIGHVVTHKRIIEKTREPLKKVLRLATEGDFETVRNNRELENEARLFCAEKAKAMNLQMKVVATETTLDKKRLTFYFTADGRIDFRELVRDLAAKFKTRIEMRQIGVRDEVKLLGGFGCCGRQTCCSLFLTSFAPITIRMAKEQALSINQSKLSGICGRLMCCLGYEHREAPAEEAVTPSSDEAIITVTEEPAEISLLAVESAAVAEEQGAGQPETSARSINAVGDKSGDARPQPEQTQDKTAEKHRRFKRDRRWKKKHKAEKAPAAEGSPAKQPQAAAPDTSAPPESKDKGRPNRRRKFWKHKKKADHGPETAK